MEKVEVEVKVMTHIKWTCPKCRVVNKHELLCASTPKMLMCGTCGETYSTEVG